MHSVLKFKCCLLFFAAATFWDLMVLWWKTLLFSFLPFFLSVFSFFLPFCISSSYITYCWEITPLTWMHGYHPCSLSSVEACNWHCTQTLSLLTSIFAEYFCFLPERHFGCWYFVTWSRSSSFGPLQFQ